MLELILDTKRVAVDYVDQSQRYLKFNGLHETYLYVTTNELTIDAGKQTVHVTDDEFRQQIINFIDGHLTLHRGISRQHPYWYEARYLGLLMPIGLGQMPDFSTNLTAFIPFSASNTTAVGAATSVRGMGPGDSQQMLADYPTMYANSERSEVGLVMTVQTGPATGGVAFYNAREIQVLGPIFAPITTVQYDGPNLPTPVPTPKEVATYAGAHGYLRHQKIVDAIAQDHPAATGRFAAINTDPARRQHAAALQTMRQAIIASTTGVITQLQANIPTDQRPGKADNGDFHAYLDSSVNRIGHEAYVAAIAAGKSATEAGAAGLKSAVAWLTVWNLRMTADPTSPVFTVGWETPYL